MATKNMYGLLSVLCVFVGSALGVSETCSGQGYRLPCNVEPVSYTLELQPLFPSEPEKITDFTGKVTIVAKAVEEGNNIVLHHGKEITPINIQITDNEGETELINNAKLEYDETTHKLTIPYEIKDVMVNNNIEIVIEYEGKLQTDMSGFYRSTYTVEGSNGNERTAIILATQFESTDARKAFPCFDEPHFKSTFQVSLTVPKGYSVLSNTPEKAASELARKTREDGDVTFQFEETAPMPTYLLAFIVYEDDTYDRSYGVITKTDVQITSWGRKNAVDQHLMDFSQEITHRILEELETYTGINFIRGNMKKIDQAAIPDFSAGAMENWGLVTYRETGLFFTEENSTESDRKSIAMVIAHELTHQWFGNLVTTDWWSSTWLNEGFARYFQYYIMSVIKPSWRMMEQFLVEQQQVVFEDDALESAKPITNMEVETPNDISGQFSSAAYRKGGCVLRLINLLVGEDKFREGIQKYLADRGEKTATPDDLFSALSTVVSNEDLGLSEGYNLQKVLKGWTEKAGYPVITLLQETNGIINIRQERFLLEDSTEEETTYPVKLTAIFEDGMLKSSWLLEAAGSISTDGKSLLIIKNTGYFRVNYDVGHWRKLSDILLKNKKAIEPLERATLIDNALNLARTGRLGYDSAFYLISYLQNEIDYIPWASASSALDFIYRMMGDDADFQGFIKTIVENLYNELEFADDGEHLTLLHRNVILRWACRVDLEGCRTSAAQLLSTYLNEKQLVPANLRSIVYCYGVKGTGKEPETLWNKLWYHFKENEDVAERSLLIQALGCTDSASTLYMYLEESLLDRYIRSQDASKVYEAVYSNRDAGVDVAIDFFVKNLDRIKKVYVSMNALRNVVQGIAGQITTKAQSDKFLDFLSNNKDDPALENLVSNAENAVNANLQWISTRKQLVVNAIKGLKE